MTASRSGSFVAAPIRPPTHAPQDAERERVPGRRRRSFVASVSPPIDREDEHQQAERDRDDQRPRRAGRAAVAPSVRWICQRVVNASAVSGIASRIIGWMRRLPASRKPGVDHRREQRADRLPERLDEQRRVDAGEPDQRRVRGDQRDQQAGDEHDARRPPTPRSPRRRSRAARAARAAGPDSSAACGSTRPIRSWNVLAAGGGGGGRPPRAPAAGRPGSPPRSGNVGAGRSSSSGSAGGGAGGGTARITASVGNVGAGRSSTLVREQELVLAGPAGRAEARAGADALAAIGAEARLGQGVPVCLPSGQWVSLAADGRAGMDGAPDPGGGSGGWVCGAGAGADADARRRR